MVFDTHGLIEILNSDIENIDVNLDCVAICGVCQIFTEFI